MIAAMNTTGIGRSAEQAAATHLEAAGYTMLDRNWHNRWCEIDIVATRQYVLHIIEVKYRKSSQWGSPAEYISATKAARLKRAALAYIQAHHYNGAYQIDVVCVEGNLTNPHIQVLENAIGD